MSKMEIVEDIYQHPENYRAEDLEHHVRMALRELALENVRKKEFSQYPSRMSCLYVSETMEEAEKWAVVEIMKQINENLQNRRNL